MPSSSQTWNVANGEWSTANDWTPSGVPSASIDATLGNGGAISVSGSDYSAEASTLTITNGSVTIDGELSVGSLSMSGGSSSITVNGGSLTTGELGTYSTENLIGNITVTNDGVVEANYQDNGAVSGTISLENGGEFIYATSQATSTGSIVDFGGGGGGYLNLQGNWEGSVKNFGSGDYLQFNESQNDTISSFSYSSSNDTLTVVTTNGTFHISVTETSGTYQTSDFATVNATPNELTYVGESSPPPENDAPAVASVSVPSNGTYHDGQTLSFTVNFSAAVDVTGTPEIALVIGAQTVEAAYTSGSGSNDLVFQHVIAAGEQANDGITLDSSINLNGGSIEDSSNDAATLTLNSVGATSGIDVHAVLPTVSSIVREDDASNNGGDEVFSVTFSESMSGVAANDFIASPTGTVSDTGVSVSGSGSAYTVTVSGATGTGTLGLDVTTGATDSYGNHLASTYSAGPTYTINSNPPSVSAVSVSGASSPEAAHAGDDLSFHVTFSEAVTVGGTPELSLSNGRDATYVSGSGTNDLLFAYTVEGGQYSNDLHVNDLVLNGGSINDAAGNAANDSASFDTGVSVDTSHPTISVTASSAYAIQGGSAIPVLSGAPTITDTDGSGHYDHVTVSLVGAQSGDSLSVLGAAEGSVIVDATTFLIGGSGSDELTISTGNTAANYEAVLNDVLFTAGANDTVIGSHPSVTIEFSVTNSPQDGLLTSSFSNATVEIDRAPSVSDQTVDAAAGGTVSMSAASGALNGDTDPDGDSLSIASVAGASSPVAISSSDVTVSGSYGELTIGADGHYSYTAGVTNDEVSALSSAATGSHPVDSFLLTVSDGQGATTAETLDVSLDRAPGALTNAATVTSAVNEEAAAGTTVGVTAHAVDPDGDTVSYSISNDSSGGGFTINASTGVVGVADPSDIDYASSGNDHSYTITVEASDGTLTSSQSFIIAVNDVAPTISGAAADQATTDKLAISPFAAVTISGASSTQEETVHVTIGDTVNGAFTAESLTNSGFVADTVVAGQYDFTGTVANDTTAIEQLVFSPTQNQVTPGQTVTTDFTIYAGDGTVGANDTTTSVVATSVNDPPTITGTVANQTITDNQTAALFAHVTIGDPDVGQTETVTITPSFIGDGAFSNLGVGGLNAAGDYTVAGSTSAVTAALDGLVFVPTAHLAAANVPIDTTFTIAVSDGDTVVSNSDTSLSVVSTAAPTTDHGTNEGDTLTADPGGDTVLGLNGDDTISGGTGHDQLYGNTGNDVILLLSYTDSSTVYGGQGDDVLDARRSSVSNFLSGDLGNDSIMGGAGNDTMYGGDGDDTLVGGSGHDQLYGNAGDDHIVLGAANMGSTVYGGQGDDVVDASASTHANYISGDLGNDLIIAGSGGDTIYGGEGSDTIQAAAAAPTYIHVGSADSSAVSAADMSQLDHITNFNSQTQLVFDGDPSATAGNTVFHGGDPQIANYAAAYAYAYGGGGNAGIVTGSTEYAVVSDTAGHVYIFAQDHAAVEIDGLSGGVGSVAIGQILSA